MKFESVVQLARLEAFLGVDRVASAYPLSYLDPIYASFCSWYEAVDQAGRMQALLLIYRGLSVPAVMTLGEAEAVAALVEWATPLLPRRFYMAVPEAHTGSLLMRHHAPLLQREVRMSVTDSEFRCPESLDGVVRVGHADTADLMDLYRHYPDAFFEPYQLESGYYFGIREGGRLVSVAGVHSVSERYDIAVIGNIVTHPACRNRGLSTRCTGYLLNELFNRVGLVALNVDESNSAAHRTYEKLGFADRGVYAEGFAELR